MRPVAIALVLSLAGCAAQAPRLSQMAPSGALPGGAPVVPEHTLSAGDQFEIRFPFAPDYNDRVTVGMDGNVAPKQIGDVTVGGLSVAEATERLRARYATLLKAAELSITMRRFAPEVIYVDGWVARPGLIRSELPLTVARALAQAGGVKPGAQTGNILVMRHDGAGAVRTYQVALGALAGAGGEDPPLKSFDVVYVPQTALAAVSDFARQYYQSIPFSATFQVAPTPAAAVVTPPQQLAPSPPPPVTPR